MNEICIETERLWLREFELADWGAVHRYASIADILIYEPWGPNTYQQSKDFIDKAIAARDESPRHTYEMAVCLKDSGQLIGSCGLRKKTFKPERADFGYIIHPNHWNNGYATEAAIGMTKYSCEHLGVKELEATCDVLNTASRRVLEKCGLTLYYTFKEHMTVKGKLRSTHLFRNFGIR